MSLLDKCGYKFEENKLEKKTREINENKFPYSLIPSEDYAKSYGLALEALRNSAKGISPLHIIEIDGKQVIRPLTFKETLEARLDAYKTGMSDEDKTQLLNHWFGTCTGIAYPADSKTPSTKFKIIPVCEQLITLDAEFAEKYLSANYHKLAGIDLDSTQGKYNSLLTKDEVKAHPAWLAVCDNDSRLLSDYADLIFSLRPENNKLMSFWLAKLQKTGHLQDLVVGSSGSGSYAGGGSNLSSVARFVRVAHSSALNSQRTK